MNKQWEEMKTKNKKWKEMNQIKKIDTMHFWSFLFMFFCFLSLGFRDSGITCIWFLIEKMFLEIMLFLFFLF